MGTIDDSCQIHITNWIFALLMTCLSCARSHASAPFYVNKFNVITDCSRTLIGALRYKQEGRVFDSG
jgi:hypothetical protein